MLKKDKQKNKEKQKSNLDLTGEDSFVLEEDDEEQYNGSKRQKLIFAGVLIFGIAALVLAVLQLKFSLRSPFLANMAADEKLGNSKLARKEDSLFKSQNIDTDEDGIVDYDEIYTYYTSHYLKDTDSDGYNDKEEIEKGKNPNCPEGKNCSPYLDDSYIAATSTSGFSMSLDQSEPSAINTADVLRNALIEAGTPAEILNNISDEELVAEYLKLFTTDEKKSINEKDNISKEELKKLTPSQIRVFLKERGIKEEILNSIDDETLKKDFLETIESI